MVGSRTSRHLNARITFAVAAVLVFAVDRVTKAMIVASVPLNQERPAVDHLVWITHIQNSGAAFGFFPFGSTAFLVVSLVVAVGLAVYVWQGGATGLGALCLGLVMGGTVGNAYDRVLHGSVTDFVTVHWWPIFNAADSAISIGIAALLAAYVLRRREA